MDQSSNVRLRRRVWRIGSHAPQGEYVDSAAGDQWKPGHDMTAGPPESAGWLESAYELAHGLEVCEGHDKASAELLREFFKR